MASLAPYSITLGATDYPVKYAGLLGYIEPYLTNLETFSFSGGNAGIGVTPSAWGILKGLQFPGGALVGNAGGVANNQVSLYNNAYFDGANERYLTSDTAQQFRSISGAFQWRQAPGGTAGGVVTFTQSMTLDVNGRLCVGVTTPINNNVISAYGAGQNGFVSQVTNNANSNFQGFNSSGVATFQVLGSGIAQFLSAAAGTLNYVDVGRTAGEARTGVAAAGNDFLSGTSAGDAVFYKVTAGNAWYGTAGSGAAIFATNNQDRGRITAGGDLLINLTAATFTTTKVELLAGTNQNGFGAKVTESAYTPVMAWNSATTGDNSLVYFYTEATATARGDIRYNRAAGLVAYNTTSDYRAKDILGPVQNPGAVIDALKVYEGRMKGATQTRPMLVAHEAQEVTPYAVSGVKDDVDKDGIPKFQQIDVSSLVPLILAELQCVRARVAALELP